MAWKISGKEAIKECEWLLQTVVDAAEDGVQRCLWRRMGDVRLLLRWEGARRKGCLIRFQGDPTTRN